MCIQHYVPTHSLILNERILAKISRVLSRIVEESKVSNIGIGEFLILATGI